MTEWLQQQLLDEHPQKLDRDSVIYTRRHHLNLDQYDVYQIDLNQQQAWVVTEEEGFPKQLTACPQAMTKMLLCPFQDRNTQVDHFFVNVLKPTYY